MRSKYLFLSTLFVFLFILSCVFIPSAYSEEAQILNLDLLINEALENNPQIQTAYNKWRAAEYKVIGEKSLPDPMASYTYFGDNVETRVGPQEQKYGFSQKVPFPGKLGLKGRAQLKNSDMLKEKYEAAKREVIKNVKLVYYDIFWVDRSIQITEEEKTIFESLEKVAQTRYESNLTPQQDVIKAQVELSKLIDKLFMLRQNRKSLVAKLNSILNRPERTKLGTVGELELTEFKYDINDLHEISRQTNPELLAANLDVEKSEYERKLAKLNYLPDFTFGFDYIRVGSGHTTMPNDGQDAWMGTIAVNVPIWFGKLSAQLNEKKALLEADKRHYLDVENNLTYETEDLFFKITTYRDIISLYKTALIPQTEQSFEAAKTGYETGKVDFLNWLDAERILLQTRLAYYKSIADYQKSIAYLERVIGKDL